MITKLNIIYRTCDTVNACSMRKPRMFGLSKNELCKKCLQSLKMNIDNLDKNIQLRFICVADKCTQEYVEYIKTIYDKIEFVFLDEKTGGNTKSFCKCVEIANSLPDNEIVYFLEDDYLFLRTDILNKIVVGMNELKDIEHQDCSLIPYDYPGKFDGIHDHPHVVQSSIGYFLQTDNSCCTFVMTTNLVKQNLNFLNGFSKWPFVTEETTINRCHRENNKSFIPIPSWTIHFQEECTIPKYVNRNNLKQYCINKT